MAASDFQNRWAKKNAQQVEAAPVSPAAAPVEAPVKAAPKEPQPLPTLEDVARLSADSDYSAFVAKGVDENVKRSAMKKLFANPHFNIMDGLDIYIDDYTNPAPIPPEMLALLEHAKSVLNPLKHLESPAMRMISRDDALPANQGEGTPEDVSATDQAGDNDSEQAGSSQPADATPEADAEKSANDAAADAGTAPMAPDDSTDMPDPGTLADTKDPAKAAGQHEHHTGAAGRPDDAKS